MIGGGHIADMIARMKVNKELLEKAKFKSNLFPGRILKKHFLRKVKADPELIHEIHEKMEHEMELDKQKTLWAMVVTLIIISLLVWACW